MGHPGVSTGYSHNEKSIQGFNHSTNKNGTASNDFASNHRYCSYHRCLEGDHDHDDHRQEEQEELCKMQGKVPSLTSPFPAKGGSCPPRPQVLQTATLTEGDDSSDCVVADLGFPVGGALETAKASAPLGAVPLRAPYCSWPLQASCCPIYIYIYTHVYLLT